MCHVPEVFSKWELFIEILHLEASHIFSPTLDLVFLPAKWMMRQAGLCLSVPGGMTSLTSLCHSFTLWHFLGQEQQQSGVKLTSHFCRIKCCSHLWIPGSLVWCFGAFRRKPMIHLGRYSIYKYSLMPGALSLWTQSGQCLSHLINEGSQTWEVKKHLIRGEAKS